MINIWSGLNLVQHICLSSLQFDTTSQSFLKAEKSWLSFAELLPL